MRWRFFITNFAKKRLQHRCFPMNIAKCLGKAFYIEPQPAFTCSKLTLETTEQVVKYVQT